MSLPLNETQFQAAVLDAAHRLGWRVAHFRRAQVGKRWMTPVAADGKGFPDLVLVHPERGELLFAELKVPGNSTTREQKQWIGWLTSAGAEVRVWRPDSWPEIERALRGKVAA